MCDQIMKKYRTERRRVCHSPSAEASEPESPTEPRLYANIIAIEHGRKLQRPDPWDPERTWTDWDPIEAVGFFNPKKPAAASADNGTSTADHGASSELKRESVKLDHFSKLALPMVRN